MAGERFEFEYEFKVSDRPVARAADQLERMERAATRAQRATDGFDDGWMGGVGGRARRGGQDPAVAYLKSQERVHKQRMSQEREYERFWQRSLREQDHEQRRIMQFQSRMRMQQQREEIAHAARQSARFQTAASIAGGVGMAGLYAGGVALAGGALLGRQLNQFGDEAIAAGGQRTSSLRTYSTLLGSRPLAELEYYRAQRFAQQTDLTSAQVEEKQNMLMTQGFRDKELQRALAASADLAAGQPEAKRKEALDAATRYFVKVSQKGYLTLDEVNEEFATAGGSGQILRELVGKHFGKTGSADIEKLFSDKKVSANVGLALSYQAILKQLNTTKLGEFSTKSAGSLTSLISNVDEGQKNLGKSFDFEALPAVDRYKSALTDLSRVYDVNTKSGRDLVQVYQDVSNQVVHAKAGWTEFRAEFLDSFSDHYLKALQDLNPGQTKSSADAIKDLASSIGRVGGVAARAMHMFDGLGSVWEAIPGLGGVEERQAARERRRAAALSEQEQRDRDSDQKTLTAAQRYLADQNLLMPGGFNTLDALRPQGLESTYGPPVSATPTADERARFATKITDAKKKARAEAGWSTPIWHYAQGGGGSVLSPGADALSAVVASSAASSQMGSADQRPIVINQQITAQPGQSTKEIAQLSAALVAAELRSLARSPHAGPRR